MSMINDQILHVLICGGRHFKDYDLLKATVTKAVISRGFQLQNAEIISGNCLGADMLGERYAKEHNTALKLFPAQWKRFGKAAGPIRNKLMIDYIDSFKNKVVIAFVSPSSKGTRNTISLAQKLSIDVIITEYLSEESK